MNNLTLAFMQCNLHHTSGLQSFHSSFKLDSMKNLCLATMIVVLLLICFNSIKAQTTDAKLNQVELWKKFSGTWQGQLSKDTFIVYDNNPYGTGMETNIKIVTQGKALQEGKGLFGYDKESDKIIEATLLNGSDIICNAYWFTSENKCTGIQFKYIQNPENSILKWEIEFKTPDMWVVTSIEDNKAVEIDTLYRLGMR